VCDMDENKAFPWGLDEVTKKIADELDVLVEITAERLENAYNRHDVLRPIIDAWMKGEKVFFEFNGITSTDIMEKETSSYAMAILRISTILEVPDIATWYKEIDFYEE
jgi:hypothetical protein